MKDNKLSRRETLRKGAVAAGGLTLGAAGAGSAIAQPNKQKGGSGVLVHAPGSVPSSFEKFRILSVTEGMAFEFEYERGCGKGGNRRDNIKKENRAYELRLLDADCNPVGGGSALWVQPSHKEIGDRDDIFKVNNLCETDSTYTDVAPFPDAASFWITFAPDSCP